VKASDIFMDISQQTQEKVTLPTEAETRAIDLRVIKANATNPSTTNVFASYAPHQLLLSSYLLRIICVLVFLLLALSNLSSVITDAALEATVLSSMSQLQPLQLPDDMEYIKHEQELHLSVGPAISISDTTDSSHSHPLPSFNCSLKSFDYWLESFDDWLEPPFNYSRRSMNLTLQSLTNSVYSMNYSTDNFVPNQSYEVCSSNLPVESSADSREDYFSYLTEQYELLTYSITSSVSFRAPNDLAGSIWVAGLSARQIKIDEHNSFLWSNFSRSLIRDVSVRPQFDTSLLRSSFKFLGGGFVSSSRKRGTSDILWSCLWTIFLCTWTATRLNVPGPGESRIFRKFKWTIAAMLAPEVLLFMAW
jgi:hypothetical protein